MEVNVKEFNKLSLYYKGTEFRVEIFNNTTNIYICNNNIRIPGHIKIPNIQPTENLVDYFNYITNNPEMINEIKKLKFNNMSLFTFGMELKKIVKTNGDFRPIIQSIKNKLSQEEKIRLFEQKIGENVNALGGFRYNTFEKENIKIFVICKYRYTPNITTYYIFKFNDKGLIIRKTNSKALLCDLIDGDYSLKRSRKLNEKDITCISKSNMDIVLKGLFADELEYLKKYQIFITNQNL